MKKLSIVVSSLLPLGFVLASGCGGQEADATGNNKGAGPTPSSEPVAKTYPETTDGLTQLATDLLNGRPAQQKAITAGLKYDKVDTWFAATFAPDAAKRGIAEFRKHEGNFATVDRLMASLKAKGRTQVTVEKYVDAKDPGAVAYQMVPLKEAKTKGLALYSVRFTEPGKTTGFHLYSFVYVDGGFRFMGKMKALHAKGAPTDPKMNAVSELRARDREIFFKTGKLPGSK